MRGLIIILFMVIITLGQDDDDAELMELKIHAIDIFGKSREYCCYFVLGINDYYSHPYTCETKIYDQKGDEGKTKLTQCKLFNEKFLASKNTE